MKTTNLYTSRVPKMTMSTCNSRSMFRIQSLQLSSQTTRRSIIILVQVKCLHPRRRAQLKTTRICSTMLAIQLGPRGSMYLDPTMTTQNLPSPSPLQSTVLSRRRQNMLRARCPPSVVVGSEKPSKSSSNISNPLIYNCFDHEPHVHLVNRGPSSANGPDATDRIHSPAKQLLCATWRPSTWHPIQFHAWTEPVINSSVGRTIW